MVPRPEGQPAEQRTRRPRKPNRFVRHWRTAQEIRQDPRSIPRRLRAVLLEIWLARGGGFYGIGYVVAFFYFEVQVITGELAGSASVGDFVLGQALEYVFRVGVMSFVSALQALLWPLFVVSWWDGVGGILFLLGSYLAFEHVFKPWIEAAFPELREHRLAREEARAAKRDARAVKRAARAERKAARTRDRHAEHDSGTDRGAK